MKKLLLIALATCLAFGVASAQQRDLHFGTSDGSDLWVTIDSDIEIPVYYSGPDTEDVAFVHIPLASDDAVITSRDGGVFLYPLSDWDDASFLDVEVDNPVAGWTNQSVLGFADLGGDPNPFLIGDPQIHFMTYVMHTADDPGIIDSVRCPFGEGDNDPNGLTTFGLSDGITQFTPDLHYGCLFFTPNNDPEWTLPLPGTQYGIPGFEFCFDIAGSDADEIDDLHITMTSGPGTFTETAGGPGGVAAGTWCGNLAEGNYTVCFELDDNAGGEVLTHCVDLVVEYDPACDGSALSIDCVGGTPGTAVWVPVNLRNTCLVGGYEILISWDPTAIDLMEVVPDERSDFGDEYFNVNLDDGCEECPVGGSARVVWISDINNGVPNDPMASGGGPIFWMHFMVDSGFPFGFQTDIVFVVDHYSDNTISDETGYVFAHPTLADGCVNVVDPITFMGDPNMNGAFYEIADAVLVARRLIEGYPVWAENGTGDDALQETAADLNTNGFVDVADLVQFINIINGNINPPRLDPTSEIAKITMPNVIGSEMTVSVSSGAELGGALVTIDHAGVELGTPVAANGMEVLSRDVDGVLNLVVFSLEGNSIAAGNSDLVTIPVVANNGGTMEFNEVSAADIYGSLLEASASTEAPLPTEFAVHTNYPNPFNAKTLINFDLPSANDVDVSVYSITGQLVETISGHYAAGSHSVTWDASDVASGVYFYKVSAGDFSQTMKMTLLK